MNIVAYILVSIFAYFNGGRLFAGDNGLRTSREGVDLNASYLIDDGSLNNWALAISALSSGRFISLPSEGTNLGYHAEPIWIAIDLRGQKLPESLCCFEVSYPLDQVDLYVVRDGMLVSKASSGILNSTVDSGQFRWKNRVFNLNNQFFHEAIILLKVTSRTVLGLKFSLFTVNDFIAALIPDALVLGAFYGSLLLVLIFISLLLPFIRTKLLAYYLIYLASYIAVQMVMNGIPGIIIPDASFPWIRVVPFLAPMVTMSLILMTRQYFYDDFERHGLRKWSNILLASSFAVFLGAAGLPYEYSIRIAMLQGFVVFGGLIIFGAVQAWRRQPDALLYFVSWLAFLSGGSCLMLKTMQVLPSNFVTNYSMQIGAWVQIIALSFGVGKKFRVLKTREMKNERRLLRMHAEVSLAKDIKKNRENLAHDLRTPLAVLERILIGEHDLASSAVTSRSEGLEALARMHSTIESLKESEREMIVRPERTIINFETLVNRLSIANGCTIKVTGEPMVEVIVDRPQLDRVIENLVLNAIEAGASEIEVSAQIDGRYLVIGVLDDGPGIPEKFTDQLFSRGFTWNKPGGKGFGLDIVATIIAGHRGTIEYQRVDGQTQFLIRIPQVVVSPNELHENYESQDTHSIEVSALKDTHGVLLSLSNKSRQDEILSALSSYPIKIYFDENTPFSRGVIYTDRPEIIGQFLSRNIPIIMDNGKDDPEKIAKQLVRRFRMIADLNFRDKDAL